MPRILLTALIFTCAVLRASAASPPSAAERFLALLERNDFSGAFAQFSPDMKAALPEHALRAAWHGNWEQVGNLQRVLETVQATRGGKDVVTLTCQFERGRRDVIITFEPDATISGLFFRPSRVAAPREPPPYSKIDSYHEEDVVVRTGRFSLPGTLSLPVGDAACAGVVLVHGSGPHDRDEAVGGVRPFRDLAAGLASRGIAVLRYEKRTKVVPLAEFARADGTFTVDEETVEDAVAAIARLRQVERIDAKRLFVIGHSLGATVAPRMARRDAAIAGLVMLAGSPRPLEELILEQNRYLLSLHGAPSRAQEAQMKSVAATANRLRAFTAKDAGSAELVWGAPARYWMDLRRDDPLAAARTLSQPMLILQGERDYQVTMQDFAQWKSGLAERPNVTFKSYPRLNHLFVEGEGPSQPAEYDRPAHVAAEVVSDIAAWIERLAATNSVPGAIR